MTLLVTGSLFIGLAVAQQGEAPETDPAAPPPIPPKVPNEAVVPTVTITQREEDRVEEYSRNGRVYMVKITPIVGPSYWYFDENGDGQLELQDTNKGHGPVRPVYWKLKEW